MLHLLETNNRSTFYSTQLIVNEDVVRIESGDELQERLEDNYTKVG